MPESDAKKCIRVRQRGAPRLLDSAGLSGPAAQPCAAGVHLLGCDLADACPVSVVVDQQGGGVRPVLPDPYRTWDRGSWE
jgi:hypothetical protein